MDFSLSEEQQDVQNLARQILADHTENEQLKRIDQDEDHFDQALWQALGEAGLLGLAVDEAHGGMGYGFETLCLLLEEIGRHVAPVPALAVLANTALVLQRFGTAEQQADWLPGITSGQQLLTAAMIEPANENPQRPRTQAARQDDGSYRLTGKKHCVVLANRAERILMAAQSDAGPVACLLDPRGSGVTLQRQTVTTGEAQFELAMDGAIVAAADILAEGDAAQGLLDMQHQYAQAAICAMSVGLCDRMTRLTAEYTSQREQFGQPIATFQAVAHRAAECYIDVECLRLVTQQAVALLQEGREADEAVAIAKIWCGDVTHRVSQAAQHLHGGIGVDRDYPLFRYSLWARQLELTQGTSAALTFELGQGIAAAHL